MEGDMGEAKSANGREFMGFSYHYGGNSWDFLPLWWENEGNFVDKSLAPLVATMNFARNAPESHRNSLFSFYEW